MNDEQLLSAEHRLAHSSCASCGAFEKFAVKNLVAILVPLTRRPSKIVYLPTEPVGRAAFVIVVSIVLLNYKYILKSKVKKQEGDQNYSFFKKPDPNLIWLGIICFCCMASEGIMFDWSGVYFKEIVKAPSALITLC